MAEIPPAGPGRSHGTDLADPRHAAALGTAIRYHTAAGMATQRALRDVPRPPQGGQGRAGATRRTQPDAPAAAPLPEPANQNCTNEFPAAARTRADAPEPAEPGAWASRSSPVPPSGERRPTRTFSTSDDGSTTRPGSPPCPWSRPTPSARPSGAEALMKIEFRQVRRLIGARALARHRAVSGRRRPGRLRGMVRPPAQAAAQPGEKPDRGRRRPVERVTRHNPPWIRGQYLGYYRPPVPGPPVPARRHRRRARPWPRATAAGRAGATETPAALRARVARLLDRSQPRLAEELDLAEAICAVKWPNWPDYRGPIDLDLLRLALERHPHRRRHPALARQPRAGQGVPGGGRERGQVQLVHRARNHRLRAHAG